jgi:hypothetical protein
MVLRDNFMIRTAHPEIYQELQQKKKMFKLQIHLFTAALVIGVLNKAKSQLSPNHDIIRLRQLHGHLKPYRGIIDILSQIICRNKDERACGAELLAYADGGLELLWEEYQSQGTLDLPRIVEETKNKWPQRIPELLIAFKQSTYDKDAKVKRKKEATDKS